MTELTLVANPARSVLFTSHDRTMQDIVYKLVPGLQEGKCQMSLGSWCAAWPWRLSLGGPGLFFERTTVPGPCSELTGSHLLVSSAVWHSSASSVGKRWSRVSRLPATRGSVGAQPGAGARDVYLCLKRNTWHTRPESLCSGNFRAVLDAECRCPSRGRGDAGSVPASVGGGLWPCLCTAAHGGVGAGRVLLVRVRGGPRCVQLPCSVGANVHGRRCSQGPGRLWRPLPWPTLLPEQRAHAAVSPRRSVPGEAKGASEENAP